MQIIMKPELNKCVWTARLTLLDAVIMYSQSSHVESVMRHLNIEMCELELTFEGGYETIAYYLDLETGKVIAVNEEARGILEIIYDSYYDEKTQIVDWESAFENERVPDWQREMVQDADRVEAGFGDTIIAIPSESSSQGYSDMEDFIDTIRNPRLRESLERALRGRGAFRYFKDVLLDYPTEREHWFQIKHTRLQQRISEWLEEHGITTQQYSGMIMDSYG
jgi:hypothetical protein